MSEDEEHEFGHEARGGVNLLGKAGHELAKARFDGFAKMLKREGFVRLVEPPPFFAYCLLAAAGRASSAISSAT